MHNRVKVPNLWSFYGEKHRGSKVTGGSILGKFQYFTNLNSSASWLGDDFPKIRPWFQVPVVKFKSPSRQTPGSTKPFLCRPMNLGRNKRSKVGLIFTWETAWQLNNRPGDKRVNQEFVVQKTHVIYDIYESWLSDMLWHRHGHPSGIVIGILMGF